MRKQTLMATTIVILCLVLFNSCEDKVSGIELIGTKSSDKAVIGEEVFYRGTNTDDISSVQVYYDQTFAFSSSAAGGGFSFGYTHLDIGEHFLNLKGVDQSGGVVAEANYRINVVEEVDSDAGDRPDLFDFNFAALDSAQQGEDHTLWATYYYLPQVSSIANGHALLDMNGDSLGPVLSLRNWCFSAMEGSVRVLGENGIGITYNYAGTSDGNTVDCTSFFAWDVSRTKFRVANGAYGDGVLQYKLVPFRTVAVDPTFIPYGSVIYIPKARGNSITLPDGTNTTHDGYFFAGDTGGAIKGTHIDVYIGVSQNNPFNWIKSRESGLFEASIVNDQDIIDKLFDIHVN